MVVVVTGGRDYKDKEHVESVLEALNPDEVVAGDATGADTFALEWAQSNMKSWRRFHADWHPGGGPLDRSAGPRRNGVMLRYARSMPDVIVVAFPGGNGTADCVRQAHALGMPVLMAPPAVGG